MEAQKMLLPDNNVLHHQEAGKSVFIADS